MLVAQYVIFAATVAAVASAVTVGFATAEMIAGPAMLWYDAVAVVYGVRACRHPGLDPRTRRAACAFTVAFAFTMGISLTFSVTGTDVFPQVGDALHLVVTLLLFVAFLLVPLRAASKRERWKTIMDAGTVVLGVSMLFWYVVVGPAMDGHHASAGLILAAACYPLVDLLVLFGLARALLRGTRRLSRRALALVGGGVLALFAGDAYLGYAQAHMAAVHRSTFEFFCWLTTHLLFACGAVELWRHAADPVPAATGVRPGMASRLPYVGIGVGYLLMAAAALREPDAFPWLGLVLGGMGITGLVVLRQLLAQTESTEAAETDLLTGLANRGRLQHELSRALRRAARSGRVVAVLLIDLNGFKRINDTLGHQAGDGLLVAVAEAMRAAVRGDDMVGRLGGDEFAVVVRSITDEAGAGAVAQRITEAIAGPFIVGDLPMSASAAIGVAVGEPGALSPDALLHRADVAMYDRKRRGSGWQLWHPALGATVTAQDAFEESLAGAADAGQLRLTYAEVVSPAGELVGAEAMLSWEHPERGRIGPDMFLPIAERTGALERIGDWQLTRALADAPRWRPATYVVVTVVPQQLRRPAFLIEVGDALAEAGLRPRNLVLSVPERTLAEEPDMLGALRALGVRVAVRDFGTGYVALRGLTRRPVDLLHLTGFDGPPDPPVVEALVRVGQALGLATLVGGVEIPAGATDLRGLPGRLRARSTTAGTRC